MFNSKGNSFIGGSCVNAIDCTGTGYEGCLIKYENHFNYCYLVAVTL